MKFINNIIITVYGGTGGNGFLSFSNSKIFNKGKPDGGDGGNGGDVYINSSKYIDSLNHFNNKKKFFADNGHRGKKNNSSGKKGNNLVIFVPIGTKIIDYNTKKNIYHFVKNNEEFLVAKGGVRGIGNNKFKSSINRSPKFFSLGKKGEKKIIELKLEIFSNIGMFGLINSGKSYLFNKLVKIKNNYINNFNSTIFPVIGKVYINSYNYFRILDTPGFILDKKNIKIKKTKYLYYINECKILLHMIDSSVIINKKINFFKYLKEVNYELKLNNINLKDKNIIIIINNRDFYFEKNLNSIILNIFNKFNINYLYYILSFNNNKCIKNFCNILYNYL